MRGKKYYVWFDSLERGTMVNCLNEMRTRLISEGKYHDAIDDLLLKIIDAPTKKIKVQGGLKNGQTYHQWKNRNTLHTGWRLLSAMG
jgi:hypothetical protein